jgi:N-acetylmuramic acid 6-phosphate etherase
MIMKKPPASRFDRLPTEGRNPRSKGLDTLTPAEMVRVVLAENDRVPRAVFAERARIAGAAGLCASRLARGGRLFFIGGRLGALESAECPPTFGTPRNLVQAVVAGGRRAMWRSVEGAEDNAAAGRRAIRKKNICRDDVTVGVAASGITPFVAGALGEARARGAATVLVTCNPRAPKNAADFVIAPAVGPEVIAGSTRLKAGTATKLVLNALTTCAMVMLGKVHDNLMVDVRPTSRKLQRRAVRLVETLCGLGAMEAGRAFLSAGRNVKVAVVMRKRGLSKARAKSALAASGGSLRRALTV